MNRISTRPLWVLRLLTMALGLLMIVALLSGKPHNEDRSRTFGSRSRGPEPDDGEPLFRFPDQSVGRGPSEEGFIPTAAYPGYPGYNGGGEDGVDEAAEESELKQEQQVDGGAKFSLAALGKLLGFNSAGAASYTDAESSKEGDVDGEGDGGPDLDAQGDQDGGSWIPWRWGAGGDDEEVTEVPDDDSMGSTTPWQNSILLQAFMARYGAAPPADSLTDTDADAQAQAALEDGEMRDYSPGTPTGPPPPSPALNPSQT